MCSSDLANAWQACTRLADEARLACFDQWAAQQSKLVQAVHSRMDEAAQASAADAASQRTQAGTMRC